ncbi:hypothetical protein [Falsiroseomonas sp. CW058]|uniref:hypothetical protein n=1 Tax=Falsiroseomonas sp. CW058 TaxID=3388664 RepID=UPI003D31E48D
MTDRTRGAARRRARNVSTVARQPKRQIAFDTINRAALPHLESLCARWLPGGRVQGHEWRCGDLRGAPGRSCSVNLRTGKWADFAAGIGGGDVVSLAAAIHNLSQADAARRIAEMLGLDPMSLGGERHV